MKTRILKNTLGLSRRVMAVILTVVIVIAAAVTYLYYYQLPGEEPQKESVLYVAPKYGDPTTLDGRTVLIASTNYVTMQIYEPLVRYKGETSEIAPQLAESWEVSQDGLNCTFHLRTGVKFHDGTPFNASAARWCFEATLAIGGTPATYLGMIDKVETVGDYTLRFRLKHPSATFLPIMASTPMWQQIVSPSYVLAHATLDDPYAKDWMSEHTCGTGPYMLTEWERGVRTILTKFPNYWKGWEGKHIDKIVYLTIREPIPQKEMLRKGELDVADAIPGEHFAELNETEGISVELFPPNNMYYVFMSTHRPPLNDPLVRKAICYAIDYDAIHEHIMLGFVSYSQGAFPGAIPYHDDSIPIYRRNITKAKELMKEAGWPEKTNITLTWNGQAGLEDFRLIGEQVQYNLGEIGIDVEVLEFPWPTRIARMSDPETADDFWMWGMFPYYFDPDLYLATHFRSENTPPTGWNFAYYKNPRVDELLGEGRVTLDLEKRKEIYSELQWILFDEQPFIPLYLYRTPYVHRDYIHGRVFNPSYDIIMDIYGMWKEEAP